MSSNSSSVCNPTDLLCVATTYEQEVIVVPVLFLFAFLVTLLVLCLLQYKAYKKGLSRQRATPPRRRTRRETRNTARRSLQGIDAPPELNPLEHEVLPMTSSAPKPPTYQAAVPEMASERQPLSFNQVTPLPMSSVNAIIPQTSIKLYRARMDNRNVILRVLKETANERERHEFLGFAAFLSELGPHPFLPGLVGVVSASTPLITVVEELEHRDLLGYLWRCRQDHPGNEAPCDLTEKRLLIMAGQVSSALEYLHGKNCVHGNVGARSVLVGQDLTAKLWGLGPAFLRKTQAGTPGEVDAVEMRKWQAPEILARRAVNQSSDVWSFGILLYEMFTLGDPPFPKVMASELLQHLQRGNTLAKPANCSSSLYSLIKACCQWSPQDRALLATVTRKLQSGERHANDRMVLRVPEPIDIEKYLREAGYGEAYNYAVL